MSMLPTSPLPAVKLPLRLAAEPYAKHLSSSAVALGLTGCSRNDAAAGEMELAMLVNDDGILAFCSSRAIDRTTLLSLVLGQRTHNGGDSIASWKTGPLWLLVRSSGFSNTLQWHLYRQDQNEAIRTGFAPSLSTTMIPVHDTLRAQPTTVTPVHDAVCAKLITDSIRHYYAQQVLEPSVRGFLNVLEKQFARADLYLFELLQNAVDDGATCVRLVVDRGAAASLQVHHNGRPFTPLDVLGLSSVGLSTKSRTGKRTIGFMGVGFKAVYKRYARVRIRDGTYSFAYEEPDAHGGGYGWVMLPLWTEQAQRQENEGARGRWCHFSLERPRGGMHSILQDLAVLPATAPPLLGRVALAKTEDGQSKTWTLDWNGRVHVVERGCIQSHGRNDTSEVVTVNITDQQQGGGGQQQQRPSKWLFVSHTFSPCVSAREVYLAHTHRSHSGPEEVCGFINLDAARSPTATPATGRVHSVLPTNICLPIPMHLQGSWLLSVDRQQVQDLSDNAWNMDILKALPCLVATFFRWAAANGRLDDYETTLLPLLPVPAPHNPDTTELLGQTISLQGLQRALWMEPILPVAMPPSKGDSLAAATEYYSGERSIWVPPSFLRFVPPALLRNWLGQRPLRTDVMGGAAYHPVFASGNVIGQLDPLPDRRSQLREELIDRQREPAIPTILSLFAAVGAAYDEHPCIDLGCSTANKNKNATSKNKNGATNLELETAPPRCPALPSSTEAWPIFVTENGSLATVDQVVLPSEEFALVSPDLYALLRPYFVKEEELHLQRRHSGQQQQNSRSNNKRKKNRGQSMNSKPKLQRLHKALEEALIRVDTSDTTAGNHSNNTVAGEMTNNEDWEQPVLSFLRRARSQVPSNVVDVSSAVANLFESYSKHQQHGGITKEHILTVLKISEFALETENPRLLSFVMAGSSDSSSLKLVPASEAYASLESGDCPLKKFASSLSYLSSEYNSILQGSATTRKKFLKLLSLAGVRTGLAASITAVVDIEQDRTTLEEIVSKLPHTKSPHKSFLPHALPQQRKAATKAELRLPYGLGKVMNRRNYSFIDARLSREWEDLVRLMTPESAVEFISLLLTMHTEDVVNPTAKTVQAAAHCLSGQASDSVAGEEAAKAGSGNCLTVQIPNGTAVPLRSRLFFLPPGQPGAQALDISEAQIVKQLKTLKWLPCAISQFDLTSLTLLRPEEALLEPDVKRPEMPVVVLPDRLLERLKSSLFVKALAPWGIHEPPPPVTELLELAKEATVLFASSFIGNRSEKIGCVAAKIASVLTAIARSHLRRGLSDSALKAIKSLQNTAIIPVRRVLESRGNDCWVVSSDRCVLMPETLHHADNHKDKLKQLSIASLVASNFMCDFNHSTHNPFFSQQDISRTIINLFGIRTLSKVDTGSLIRASGSFVRHCCRVEPTISSRFPSIRSSFSYAMRWCIESPSELDTIDGGLKVWVRKGPGLGSKALSSRWVSPKNGPVQVVLDDSRSRSALLEPEMKIQTLGVLNHTEYENDCPDSRLLSQIDKEVVNHCGIWRLSDSRFTAKTRARGNGVIVEGASSKIQMVCALLRSMEQDRIDSSQNQPASISQNAFLSSSYEPHLVIRHNSLSKEFQAPGMSTPTVAPRYALFGCAPRTQRKCVLVAGEPADYSVELEELILSHVRVLSGPASQTKPYRAALRLLSHLEQDSSFMKFLNRDFRNYEVTQQWQKLVERQQILHSLKEAEKAKDANDLRRLLIIAEELCEDDSDSGDAVLRKARELLVSLEAEAEMRRKKEQQRVIMQLKEAEKARDLKALRSVLVIAENICTGEAVLHPARDLLSLLEKEANSKLVEDSRNVATNVARLGRGRGVGQMEANSKLVEDSRNVATSVASLGRGRGVGRTLPAWMTSSNGPAPATGIVNAISTPDGKTQPDGEPSGKGQDTNNTPALEGGANISMLPPKLMSNGPPMGNDPWQPSSYSNSKQITSSAELKPEAVSSTLVNDQTSLELSPANASLRHAAVERGRGAPRLPVGMARQALLSDTLKQSLRCSPEPAKEERQAKKARTEPAISEYTLRVSMGSTCKIDFIDWLKQKIKEEAKVRGGSATLLPKT